jgi:hypothetical protein
MMWIVFHSILKNFGLSRGIAHLRDTFWKSQFGREPAVDEDFSVNITDEEVELLKDETGEIRYEKVFQWRLPQFGDGDDYDENLFEFQAARMRNYMRKRVLEENYKPRYYTGDKGIIGVVM